MFNFLTDCKLVPVVSDVEEANICADAHRKGISCI